MAATPSINMSPVAGSGTAVVEPDTVEDAGAGDPFAAPVEQAEPPAEVFSLSDDDPFSSSPRGDTGVFTPGDDVFGEAPAAEPTEHEMAETSVETDEVHQDAEPQEGEVPGPAASDETPVAAAGPPSIEPASADAVDPLPLPTVTLARLALAQGDQELAERTLRGVLEVDPGNVDAAALCSEIGLTVDETQPSLPEAKIAALQGWLQTVKLGAEG